MRFEDISVGDSASTVKQFSSEDVLAFAALSTDFNPVHVDEAYAKQSFFGKRIVHGFLAGSLISATIASKLPGEGSIYLHQDMDFVKPVYLDDTITATVEVTGLKKEKNIVTLNTYCRNQRDEVVIKGTAVIKLLN
jgi:acyl dehydratase